MPSLAAYQCQNLGPHQPTPPRSNQERTMKVSFVAGFGPIVRDVEVSREFWGDGLGLKLEEAAPNYWTNDDLDGVKAFALWPLDQAAESCFGTETWPAAIPA